MLIFSTCTVWVPLAGEYVGRFAPQMMVLLSSGVRARGAEDLRLAALEGWRMLVAALAAQAPAQLGQVVFQARSWHACHGPAHHDKHSTLGTDLSPRLCATSKQQP